MTWILIFFTILSGVSQYLSFKLLEPLGFINFLELQFAFKKEIAIEIYTVWQDQVVLAYYRGHLILDLFHPLWYGVALTVALILIMRRNETEPQARWLLGVPVMTAVCDSIENGLQLYFLQDRAWMHVTEELVFISSAASAVKWTGAILSILVILVLLLRGRDPGVTSHKTDPLS